MEDEQVKPLPDAGSSPVATAATRKEPSGVDAVGRFVLLEGVNGSGKTRLARETTQLARLMRIPTCWTVGDVGNRAPMRAFKEIVELLSVQLTAPRSSSSSSSKKLGVGDGTGSVDTMSKELATSLSVRSAKLLWDDGPEGQRRKEEWVSIVADLNDLLCHSVPPPTPHSTARDVSEPFRPPRISRASVLVRGASRKVEGDTKHIRPRPLGAKSRKLGHTGPSPPAPPAQLPTVIEGFLLKKSPRYFMGLQRR